MFDSKDKAIEKERYNKRAKKQFNEPFEKTKIFGAKSEINYLSSPYFFYEKKIKHLIKNTHSVLEIGSGKGLYTYPLLKTGAKITASDISSDSLSFLKNSFHGFKNFNLTCKTADMENLPFDDNSFDVVASAGSLSYGSKNIVDKEISRILRPKGIFICVDSLNNNPIYRFNRFQNYLRGKRTKSVILNCPNLKRIKSYHQNYEDIDVRFFGKISFLAPLLNRCLGGAQTEKISNYVDKINYFNGLSFKFVMVAVK